MSAFQSFRSRIAPAGRNRSAGLQHRGPQYAWISPTGRTLQCGGGPRETTNREEPVARAGGGPGAHDDPGLQAMAAAITAVLAALPRPLTTRRRLSPPDADPVPGRWPQRRPGSGSPWGGTRLSRDYHGT
jgi:hypothetical protein